MLRIEADREQMDARCERRVAGQRLLDRREVPIHQGTEVRQRTACVYERDGQRFAPPVRKPPLLSVLIDELRVRHRSPFRHKRRRRTRHVAFRHGRLAGLPHVLEVCLPIGHHQRGGHEVSRFTSGQLRRVFHPERHCHSRHETVNVLVLDDELLIRRIDRKHLADEGVPFGPIARRTRQKREEKPDVKSPHDFTVARLLSEVKLWRTRHAIC